MRKTVLTLLFIVFGLSFLSLSLAGQPDEDKLIENLYDSGAMTGYATPPTTKPFWYGSGSPYYGPYYWKNYTPQGATGYNIEVKPVGRILIQAEPFDVEVYLDGKKLQQYPDLTFQAAVFSGAHHVDIIKEGYEKFSEDVTIYPASGMVIPVKLQKIEEKKEKK